MRYIIVDRNKKGKIEGIGLSNEEYSEEEFKMFKTSSMIDTVDKLITFDGKKWRYLYDEDMQEVIEFEEKLLNG